MKSSTRHLWVLAPVFAALLALPGLARAANLVEALNEPGAGLYSEERHYWSPEHVKLAGAGAVTFTNNSASVPHGIYWTSATHPVCEEGAGKVPVGLAKSGTSWSGSCNFSKAGAYTYYCTVHGPAMSGTIDVLGTPEASTELAGEITQTGATLHGSVKPEGNAVEYHFEYGTASVAEHSTATLSLGSEDFTSHSVSTTVTGLAPQTTYHVRLTILYGQSQTSVHAGEREVTTLTPQAPVIKAGLVSPLGETQATLKGTVDPEGEATEYRFEYGLSEAEFIATAPVTLPADSAVHSVSAALSGLQPAHEYSYRLVAKNGTGTVQASGTFTTASPPPPPGEEKPSSPPIPPPTPGPTIPEPTVPLASPPPSEPSFSLGPALIAGSLKLSGHGASVRGSIGIGPAGAGGRLEIDLLAKASTVGSRGAKLVVVGRFARAPLPGGRLSFSIALSARAKAALHHRHKLPVSVKLTLTPTRGADARLARALTLRT